MNRVEKERFVEDLQKKFKEAKFTFITDYSGLKVAEITELRHRLREESVGYQVVVNTLARLAVKNTDSEVLAEFFQGPVALAFGYKDSAVAAKVLTDFSEEQPKLEIKAGLLDGKVISFEEVKAFASLPSREVLLGRLVGLLKAVPTNLVRVMNGIPQGLVVVLKSLEEKRKTDKMI